MSTEGDTVREALDGLCLDDGGHPPEHCFACRAVAALSVLERRAEQLNSACAAVGIPADSSIETLIKHHRANAALTAGFDLLAAEAELDEARAEQKIAAEAVKLLASHLAATAENLAAAEAERDEARRRENEAEAAHDAAEARARAAEAVVAAQRQIIEAQGIALIPRAVLSHPVDEVSEAGQQPQGADGSAEADPASVTSPGQFPIVADQDARPVSHPVDAEEVNEPGDKGPWIKPGSGPAPATPGSLTSPVDTEATP